MKPKTKKRVIITASIVLLILVLKSCIGQMAEKRKATSVRLEKVQTGALTEMVTAPGQIEPKRKVDISAKVSARIVALPVKEGDRVKEGELLIQLDARDLESRLRSAKATYEAQKAQIAVDNAAVEQQRAALKAIESRMEQAESVYQRNLKLLQSKDISQATFDEFESAMEEQNNTYEAGRHGLKAKELSLIVQNHNLKSAVERIEQAKEELSYTTILAPMDGIVTHINAEVGEMVITGTMNNPGTVIMQVADLSEMLLVARVDESDIGNLQVGQKAVIRVQAYWGNDFTGTVDSIALTHNTAPATQTKYYETEIIIDPNSDHTLYSGLTADVDIETRTHQDIIKIPTQAVLSTKVDDLPREVCKDNPNVDMAKTDALLVYRMVDNQAKATPVKIGKSDMSHIIIKSGLNVGDRIVAGPYTELDKLSHNKKIVDESDAGKEQETNGGKK